MSRVVIPKKHLHFSAVCVFSLWYWDFDVVLSVLNCTIPCLMVIVVLCIYGMKLLQLKPLKLSSNDKLYRVPYGTKFLPNVLNCGAKVTYNEAIYKVYNVVVMMIKGDRWLLYKLRSCDDGSKAALSVATRGSKLRLCWWWGGESKQNGATNDIDERSAMAKKFGGGRYSQEVCGGERFVSLGLAEYPPYSFCRYELLKRVPSLLEVADSPRWLLSLSWDCPGKNLSEVFIGECIGVEDVVIRPSAVQKPGIEPEKFSEAIEWLEMIKFSTKIVTFIAIVALLYCLELIPEWLIEEMLSEEPEE